MKNIILAALLLIAISLSFADTIVEAGIVSGNWTAVGSPYQVMGNINIPDGNVLTIGPGVTVNFNGIYKLEVMGRLVCNGAVDNLSWSITSYNG